MTVDRMAEFEARLQTLKRAMENGLGERARLLRELAARLETGDEAERAAARTGLKTESHKLRGVAGSYGHGDLTALAAELEQEAPAAPPALVAVRARALADMADARGSQRPGLPDQAEGAEAKPEPARPQPAVRSQLRVLAVDDDAMTQRLLLITLQQVGGFDATIVTSAADALALLDKNEYDVVISDAMMPDMNGRAFQRAVRARGATLPFIILSAATPDELGWSLESEPGSAWLRKPFRPSELVRDVLRIARQRRR
jgi:CheY-like chemotaxis protein/HPt (histidine-containing phosphotransfer) domain-containing protein